MSDTDLLLFLTDRYPDLPQRPGVVFVGRGVVHCYSSSLHPALSLVAADVIQLSDTDLLLFLTDRYPDLPQRPGVVFVGRGVVHCYSSSLHPALSLVAADVIQVSDTDLLLFLTDRYPDLPQRPGVVFVGRGVVHCYSSSLHPALSLVAADVRH
ncbi:hypothetical protein O0L34_g10019 [Tuta absoluta]|nr:hypothetical protein O0L34_g10019 [Tuta absoluta]